MLVTSGVRRDLVAWAIDSINGVARIDSHLVLWPRSIVEKSFAILAARGTPMSAEELVAAIGDDVSVRSLRQRLYEDPRMIRVTRSTIGLRAWGGEEYTSIVDLMCNMLEERGALELATLSRDLVERFDASPSTVMALSAAPTFVVENGVIRLRRSEESFQPRAAPEQVAGLYRATPDLLVWNITADHDLMRGSGRAIPAEIATFLGVESGSRQTVQRRTRRLNQLA